MAADEAELSRAVWTRPLWSPWCRRWWGWAGIGAEARVDLLQIDFRQLETRLDVWTLWLTGHVLTLRDRSARKPLHVCVCVTGMCGSEYEFLVNEHVVNVFIETLALGKQAVRVNQLSVTSHPVSSVRCWILQVSRCRTVTSVLSLSACFCCFLIDRRQTRHTSAARDQTTTLIISFSCRSSRKRQTRDETSTCESAAGQPVQLDSLYNKISDYTLFLCHSVCAEVERQDEERPLLHLHRLHAGFYCFHGF